MLRDPVTVAVTPASTTVELIDQRAIRASRAEKPALLASILSKEPVDRALVFARTKHGADRVVRGLVQAGIPADAIHGNKSQNNREKTMAAFRSGKIKTLVATDIAARGIDVEGVSHVINYDLPNIPETYVHRIGRTARAGASGVAISLVSSDEMAFLRDIEKLIRRQVPMSGEARAEPAKREQQRGDGRHREKQPRQGKGRPHRGQRDGGGKQQQGRGKRQERPNAPSRPHNGEAIGDVGFMNRRARRGGMPQGSASR
jgi:superfamily II DNA/RNA helicase